MVGGVRSKHAQVNRQFTDNREYGIKCEFYIDSLLMCRGGLYQLVEALEVCSGGTFCSAFKSHF
jgi:hypothetical protein